MSQEYQLIHVEVAELDLLSSQELQGQTTSCIEAGQIHIIIDLSEVQIIKSSGIGTLVAILKRIQQEQGNLKLIGLRPPILEVFKIANLKNMFELHSKVL